jgi:diguanylate cyclase (GGDEF)-like protein
VLGGSGSTGATPTALKGDRFGVGRRGGAALAACALLLVGALSFVQLRAERNAQGELVERFRERAEFASDFAATAFAQSAASVRASARDLLARVTPDDRALARFMRAAAPEDAYATLTDGSGRLLATFPPGLPASRTADTGAADAALAHGSFTGGIIPTPEGRGLEIAVRFQGTDGPLVVSDAIDAAPLDRFFDQFLAGIPNLRGGQGFVVDMEGEVIGSSGPETPGRPLRDDELAAALRSGATTGTYGDEGLLRFVAVDIPRSNLRVVLTAPAATLLSPADEAANLGWILIALVTLAGIAVVCLLIGHLNRQHVVASARASLHDPLTGLPNRAHLTAGLAAALADLDGAVVAVVALGLDRFGRVNESLGAGVGDRVLVEVARRLTGAAGPDRTVARLGGDEFAVVVPGVESLDDADAAIEELRTALRPPVQAERHELVMSASFGVALAAGDDQRAEIVVAAAGEALARAKRSGRPVAYAEPDRREHTQRRLRLESDLRAALQTDQLVVYYQPIVELADKRMVGVEALLRWEHPELGPIPPSEFIPLAEESGLIAALGEFVLARATEETVAWRSADRALTLHVNLSAKQLIDPTLYLLVSSSLTGAGMEPGRLCLEVTETAILEDPQLAKRHLEELRGLGVHLALDDFGVGYSSLSHVADLAPIDRVKIDRSFISRIGEQREGAIVASIVSLCEELGLETVAEGVETDAQRAELRAMQVRQAQGFLFARPAPPEVIEAALGLVAT